MVGVGCLAAEAELYRMKGVLAVHGDDRKFVFQAVHMINIGGFTEAWADGEERVTKLTIIGKDASTSPAAARGLRGVHAHGGQRG